LPPGTVPTNTTHHAVVAIELHGAFLDRGDDGPDPDAIRVVLRRRFDASP
jgi:hypothetical protein